MWIWTLEDIMLGIEEICDSQRTLMKFFEHYTRSFRPTFVLKNEYQIKRQKIFYMIEALD